ARTDSSGAGTGVRVPEHVDEDDGAAEPAELTSSGTQGVPGETLAAGNRSARGVAMAGEETVAEPAAAGGTGGQRGARPNVEPGQPLSRYGDDELDSLAAWIAADGTPRTVAELQEELRTELGITRRGMHVDTVLGAAARRSGLATDAYETTHTPAWAAAHDAPAGDTPSGDASAGDAGAEDTPVADVAAGEPGTDENTESSGEHES